MNIRGIQVLREHGYPGPKHEVLLSALPRKGFKLPAALDLDHLYDGAVEGAALIAFDYRESIRQHQYREKDEHAYPVPREAFGERLEELTDRMREKGVPEPEIVYIAHQAYGKDSIVLAGKLHLSPIINGVGEFSIDLRRGFRPANSGEAIPADYSYYCPYSRGSFNTTLAVEMNHGELLPSGLRRRLMDAVLPFTTQVPLIDFEVHKDWGLFYHDLSFDAVQPL